MEKDKREKRELTNEFIEKYKWLVRPCEDYKREARECTSIRGRFHQYFLHGTLLDCSTWKQDLQNCKECTDGTNIEACKSIIKNETERRLKRISGSKKNDVWKKRDKPPANWNKQVSQYWQSTYEKSVLAYNVDEYKQYISTHEPDERYSCIIL